MQLVAITGGSGFVGRHITRSLVDDGYGVVIFTRDPGARKPEKNVFYSYWDPQLKRIDVESVKVLDAVINLAGAGIADKRWTDKRKKEILDSRVSATTFLVDQLERYGKKCKMLISASAIGYYGPDNGGEPFVESDEPADDFLAGVCKKWEDASLKAEKFLKRNILRFGIVLGKDGGAFPQLEQPQKFGVVPIFGSGKQVVSWIHVDDLAAMMKFILKNELHDTYNAVAPFTVSHKGMMKAIAHVKGGIKIEVPVPAALLKLALGEMSQELLKSCNASSRRIKSEGYVFKYPDISSAVKAILSKA